MNKVYLIMREYHEDYSDKDRTDVVKAFQTKEDAENYILNLSNDDILEYVKEIHTDPDNNFKITDSFNGTHGDFSETTYEVIRWLGWVQYEHTSYVYYSIKEMPVEVRK